MNPSRPTRARAFAERAAESMSDRFREVRHAGARTVGSRSGPRTGAKRTVLGTIQQLPHYLKLLGGLLLDRRVSPIDKVIVAGAIAYILLPVDLIPDFIPFLGEVDDVFLLVTSLQRLITNAGRRVVLDHWTGDPAELRQLNLQRVLSAAAFFLPLSMRHKLRGLSRG